MKADLFLPGDLVQLPDGTETLVSSSHYIDFKATPHRRMFSAFIPNSPLHYQDECTLLHRHEYKPYKGIRRCDCGSVYTTMADVMMPNDKVTWQ